MSEKEITVVIKADATRLQLGLLIAELRTIQFNAKRAMREFDACMEKVIAITSDEHAKYTPVDRDSERVTP